VKEKLTSPSRIKRVGILLLVVSGLVLLVGYPNQYRSLYLGEFIGNLLHDYYASVSTELASIALTVLIVDKLYQQRNIEREKRDLILQMGSPDNAFAREAVRRLRAQGWLTDGRTLHQAPLFQANLTGADLVDATLSQADLCIANLHAANLMMANLHKADLAGADLSEAILMGADLVWALLTGANLDDADLSAANLSGANLSKAKLQRANLVGADLSGTDLSSANLSSANLFRADLSGADLSKANLSRADLSEAKVTDEQLAQAASLKGVIMPDGAKHE
jgi:uncharacterized protein YjbI with pentapeptide repeats